MTKPLRVFLSFSFDDEWFVHRVNYYLRKQPGLNSYCYAEAKHFGAWPTLVNRKLATSDCLVVFFGKRLGDVQEIETQRWNRLCGGNPTGKKLLIVTRCDGDPRDRIQDESLFAGEAIPFGEYQSTSEDESARKCAELITKKLRGNDAWIPDDGLPIGYPFDYEKAIIEEYARGRGKLRKPALYEDGCPKEWPTVLRLKHEHDHDLRQEDVGRFREEHEQVIADTRSKYHRPGASTGPCCLMKPPLSFPEAGPREKLRFSPNGALRVGIVVSGGIAPGINSVIAGIVERHKCYCEAHRVMYFKDGFDGLLHSSTVELTKEEVDRRAKEGGSLIGTSRRDDILDFRDRAKRKLLLEKIVSVLNDYQILYVIGGDGSMRAAHAIHVTAQRLRCGLSVVGIPKTMDNDILWVWQSFGFLSAVERARQGIANLQTEVTSNPRLCIIQLFGSDSGFVVSHAALASGSCDAALIPEVPFTMEALAEHVCQRLADRYTQRQSRLPVQNRAERAYGTILLAETAIPRDVEKYIDSPDYPGVVLTEDEKAAIRTFIGSSLLNSSDISSERWQHFCKRVVDEAGTEGGFHTWLLNRLPAEIQGIVSKVAERENAQDVWDEHTMKGAVTKALNQLLEEDWRDAPELEFGPLRQEVEEVGSLMETISSNPTGLDLDHFLQGLTGIPLPHEVSEIRAILETDLRERIKNADSAELLKRDERERLIHELSHSDLGNAVRANMQEKLDADTAQRLEIGEGTLGEEEAAKLLRRMGELISVKRNRLILEAAFPKDISRMSDGRGDHRVLGQTPDELRTAGLKVVTEVLQAKIRCSQKLGRLCNRNNPADPRQPENYWKTFRVFRNEPRHLLRAIPPSVSDVVFGHRLGVLAVDNAMAGYTDFMVSQWQTEYVLVPLELVVLGRKRVPQGGIFWKSVLANTGQEADLT